MEIVVKKIGTMSNGQQYILINTVVKSWAGEQVKSAFIAVIKTELVEGSTLTLTPKEFADIKWE